MEEEVVSIARRLFSSFQPGGFPCFFRASILSQSPEGSSRHFSEATNQFLTSTNLSQSPEGSSRHFSTCMTEWAIANVTPSQSPEGSSRHFSFFQYMVKHQSALLVSIARRLFSSFQRNGGPPKQKPGRVSIARRLFSSFQQYVRYIENQVIFNFSLNRPKALLVISATGQPRRRSPWRQESQSPEGSSRHFSMCDCGIPTGQTDMQSQSPEGSSRHFSRMKLAIDADFLDRLNRPKALLVISAPGKK